MFCFVSVLELIAIARLKASVAAQALRSVNPPLPSAVNLNRILCDDKIVLSQISIALQMELILQRKTIVSNKRKTKGYQEGGQ